MSGAENNAQQGRQDQILDFFLCLMIQAASLDTTVLQSPEPSSTPEADFEPLPGLA